MKPPLNTHVYTHRQRLLSVINWDASSCEDADVENKELLRNQHPYQPAVDGERHSQGPHHLWLICWQLADSGRGLVWYPGVYHWWAHQALTVNSKLRIINKTQTGKQRKGIGRSGLWWWEKSGSGRWGEGPNAQYTCMKSWKNICY